MMVFICVIIAGTVLKLAASVVLPIVIAFLLAFAMYPLIIWLEKFKMPRSLSILLVVLIIGIGFFVLGIALYNSAGSIVSSFPRYEHRLTEIYIWIANLLELPNDESLSFWENLWGQLGIRSWVLSFTLSSFNFLISFISNAVMVIFFTLFILLEASFFKEKLEAAFEGRSKQIDKMGKDLMSQVTRYLTAKFLISLATGTLIAFGLWLIKVEFAIIWGIIAFVFNFIPTFGSIVAGVATSVFALAQFWPDPVPVILTVVLILGVNMIIGNIIDPKVIGDHVGLSAIVVLVSLTIWGYIWGFAGMILSVPMTVIIKIICENIPIMEPVSILLGSRRAVKAKSFEGDEEEESIGETN